MSRSYAKNYRLCNSNFYYKRQANKKFRRVWEFDVDGSTYKKLYCSWNINDGGRSKPIPSPNNKESIREKKEWEGKKEIGSWWADKARRK